MVESVNVITTDNNKRIAKNTSLLYLRMILVMGVSFFTSRIIIQSLGVEDYGIYSVVGGIIAMFSFINGSMVVSTQRYITFELGKGDICLLRKVFSTSIQIHGLISLIIVCLGETIGLWFLQNKMIIPEERMVAAMWVYQCSIAVCVINIMAVPYNADIIAHEKMSAFAYISIFEVLAKLAIVYLLYISPWDDRLIVYAVLLLIVQLIIRYIYMCYCHKHFEESNYQHQFDKTLLKEMAGFAGWSFWGNLAGVLSTQGVNIMLNIFFGPVVNAARGIAVQVQAVVQQFVANFQMAVNPQITKSYATGNIETTYMLMFRSARYSFYLLFVFALPIFLETEYLLALWLTEVPKNTVEFARIMILISLIYAISNPYVIANQATGKVRRYQIIVGGSLLLTLPISYIVLKLGAPAFSVFVVQFLIECVAQILRIVLLKQNIDLSIMKSIANIYLPILLVIVISSILPVIVCCSLPCNFVRLIAVVCTSILSVCITVFLVGIKKNERLFINKKLIQLFINK